MIVATVHTLPMVPTVDPANASCRRRRRADRDGTMAVMGGLGNIGASERWMDGPST